MRLAKQGRYMLFNKRKRGGFYYSKDYPKRFVWLVRQKYILKAVWRWLRVQRFISSCLGFQYKPSQDLIEIDITYLCNLRCKNCNRSSAQAPDSVHITLEDINRFVEDSIQQQRHWRRIRILGGEPTLHPEFNNIIELLLRLKLQKLADTIQVVTNGFGPKVQMELLKLPIDITVENSSKEGNVQPSFGPFNNAPKDSVLYRFTDFRHGCDIIHSCGVGLTPLGYYPCAVAGGIDRVIGAGQGRTTLPSKNDDMRDLLARSCQLCGRFRDGHYVPEKLRKPLLSQVTSPSWQTIYSQWKSRKNKHNTL